MGVEAETVGVEIGVGAGAEPVKVEPFGGVISIGVAADEGDAAGGEVVDGCEGVDVENLAGVVPRVAARMSSLLASSSNRCFWKTAFN